MRGRLSKLWQDDAFVRAAVAEARARAHFPNWPPSALAGWRTQHGRPEWQSSLRNIQRLEWLGRCRSCLWARRSSKGHMRLCV